MPSYLAKWMNDEARRELDSRGTKIYPILQLVAKGKRRATTKWTKLTNAP